MFMSISLVWNLRIAKRNDNDRKKERMLSRFLMRFLNGAVSLKWKLLFVAATCLSLPRQLDQVNFHAIARVPPIFSPVEVSLG